MTETPHYDESAVEGVLAVLDDSEEEARTTLADFIDLHRDAITRRLIESYPPMYQTESVFRQPLPDLLRKPLGAQEHALGGVILSLRENRGTIVVGEMGTGKTFIGASAVYGAGLRSALVLCPPHLVEKWKREIEITVPSAQVAIVRTITDLESVKKLELSGPLFVVLSREMAKLSYQWKPAVNVRAFRPGGEIQRDEDTGDIEFVLACPGCHSQVVDSEGLPVPMKRLASRRHFCRTCGGALWEADKQGRKRLALADYIKFRMRDFFDVLICDEVHEYKGQGTAQGIAGGILAGVCGKSLVLTGTLMGGYSSTLFHLLYRFSPKLRESYKHSDRARWIQHFGFLQRTKTATKKGDDSPFEHGRTSRRQGFRTVEKETPGLAPGALFHLIGNSVFLRLSDVSQDLPPYEEQIITQGMTKEPDPAIPGLSQAECYWILYRTLREALVKALAKGSQRLMSTYLQSLLSYPDGCTRGERVIDPDSGGVLISLPRLSEEVTYPKEQSLIELVRQEKSEGRRVLVYVTHTNVRDITGRVQGVLEQAGFRAAVLKSDTTTKTEHREQWIADKVEEGLDVLICNPRLVQTGLDLIDFPTICWYETDYSIYTMRQASRRSWRIGQTQPVKVVYMVYVNTLQQDALKLVAKKMQSSLAVEGELPEDGLVSYGDGQEDLIIAMAKRVVRGSEDGDDDGESIEAIFARTRARQADDDTLLVSGGVVEPSAPAEPEPEAAQEEVAPVEQPEEPQKEVMNWDAFMGEPAAPVSGRGRRGKAAPMSGTGSMSLFEWATSQNQKGD